MYLITEKEVCHKVCDIDTETFIHHRIQLTKAYYNDPLYNIKRNTAHSTTSSPQHHNPFHCILNSRTATAPIDCCFFSPPIILTRLIAVYFSLHRMVTDLV